MARQFATGFTHGYNGGEIPDWVTEATYRNVVADGITYVSDLTGRGGYALSKARYDQMLPIYKSCSFTSNQFFDGDCAWCAVVLSFSDCFCKGMIDAAIDTYMKYYRNK